MAATARFFIRKGIVSSPASDRGYEALEGDVLELGLESPELDVQKVEFTIVGLGRWTTTPTLNPASGPLATRTSVQQLTVQALQSPDRPAAMWIRCRINDGRKNGVLVADYTYERIIVVRNAAGMRGALYGETTQFSARSYADQLDELSEIVSSGGGGGGGTSGLQVQPLAEIDVAGLGTGNGPLSPGSTPWLVDVDGFDFELAWQQAADLPVGANLEVFSADDAVPTNRATYIKWDGTALAWTFGVRAADYWTIDNATDVSLYQYASAGDCIAARFSYWPSRGTAFARLTINGCYSADVALDTPPVSGAAINKPSALYFGSNRGTNATSGTSGSPQAPCILGHIERFTGRRHADAGPPSPEIVVCGDSIMSSRANVSPPGGGVYTEQEALERPGILTIAKGGAQISGQETDFLAKVRRADPGIAMVYVCCGVNNVIAGQTAAQVFAEAQKFVYAIRNWLPEARIVWAKCTPGNAYLTGPQQTVMAAFQALLPTLKGIDLYWDGHYATLGGGTDNLAAAYDSGDHLHPNTRGARAIGRFGIRAAAEALGVLPARPTFTPAAWRRTLTGLFLAEGKMDLDTGAVQRWWNAAHVPNRNYRKVSSAPTYSATGGPGGGPSVNFASASRQLLSSSVDNWGVRNMLSYDGGYMAVIFKATTVNSNLANIWENDALIGSPQILTGLHLKSGGGAPTLNAYQYGSAVHTASDGIDDLSIWHLAQWNFRNGSLYVKLDGEPAQSVSHAYALDLTGVLQLGEASASTSSFNGAMDAVVHRAVPCSDEELDDMWSWAQARGV